MSGSIAAYKAAFLVRGLIKAGAEVQVVITPSAADFITPLTLATLSQRPVLTDFVANPAQGTWNNHVELGLWADALVIAPSSARTLSKLAQGLCDDLLSAVYLSARCPVFCAPAMDLDMYRHPSTQRNLQWLREAGDIIIDAEVGELASGLSGQGRMAEPEHIIDRLAQYFQTKQPLVGKEVLLTAGPTHEAIDPVRFISNASSGKMGYALAEELALRGALVYLVSGPTTLSAHHPNITVASVRSAQEMYEASEAYFAQTDLAIFAAAVSDYAPEEVHQQKLKKQQDTLTITLRKTPDIAALLGKRKQPGQRTVGFALETENTVENAQAKLDKKNLDMVVLNSLNDAGAGFGHDTNQISILLRNTPDILSFPLKPKTAVAADIVRVIIEQWYG